MSDDERRAQQIQEVRDAIAITRRLWPLNYLVNVRIEAIEGLLTALSSPSPSRVLVDQQAEDGGLWFIAETAPEAYLQQALRALHAAVEAER